MAEVVPFGQQSEAMALHDLNDARKWQEKAVRALRIQSGIEKAPQGINPKPEPSDEHLVRLVDDRYKLGKQFQEDREKSRVLNRAFYRGRHWAYWDSRARRIWEPEAEKQKDWKVRIHFNMIRKIVWTGVSRMTMNSPIMRVIAGSSEEEDIQAAKAATRVLEYEWDRQDMDYNRIMLALLLWIEGDAYVKTTWDPNAGKKIVGMAEDGSDVDGLCEGEIVTEVGSTEEIFLDPRIMRWQDHQWIMHVRRVPVARVLSEYGVSVEPEADEGRYDALKAPGRQDGRTGGEYSESVIVKELWFRPCLNVQVDREGPVMDYPKGYRVVVANGQVLAHGENVYGDLPFTIVRFLPDADTFWGLTPTDDLRVLNIALNRTGSQIVQCNNMMANPQWKWPEGCEIPGVDSNNQPGGKIRFKTNSMGQSPEQVPGVGAAAEVYKFLDILNAMVQDLSGQNEGGLGGGLPSTSLSGIALEALAERDTGRLAVVIKQMEISDREWGRKVIALIKNFWEEPRTIRLVGVNNSEQVFQFHKASIKDGMDVHVVPDSAQPRTKAIRNQKAFDMWRAMDPATGKPLITTRELKRRIGEGMGDTTLELDDAHWNNAAKENRELLETGKISTVFELMQYDDEEIHADDSHLTCLLSPRVRHNPDLALAMATHMAQHDYWRNQKEQKLIQKQMMIAGHLQPAPPPGMPGEGGAPPEEQVAGPGGETGAVAGAPLPAPGPGEQQDLMRQDLMADMAAQPSQTPLPAG